MTSLTSQAARRRRKKRAPHWPVHLFLIAGVVVMTFPFLWEVLTAFKSYSASLLTPPQIIPDPWTWNFPEVLDRIPVLQMIGNSVLITVGRVVGQIILATMAGYAFARFRFRFRGPLFGLFLLTMMMPGQLFLLPQFEMVRDMGLLNTLPGVIVPGLINAFGVFLLRQFFMSLPAELEEAARIDGANPWQIFWRVMLPLAKPGIIALAVFTTLASWNDLLWPLLVLSDASKQPLAVGMSLLGADVHGQNNYPLLMSGALIAMLPMLIVFIFLQRQFIAGIAFTGSKG